MRGLFSIQSRADASILQTRADNGVAIDIDYFTTCIKAVSPISVVSGHVLFTRQSSQELEEGLPSLSQEQCCLYLHKGNDPVMGT